MAVARAADEAGAAHARAVGQLLCMPASPARPRLRAHPWRSASGYRADFFGIQGGMCLAVVGSPRPRWPLRRASLMFISCFSFNWTPWLYCFEADICTMAGGRRRVVFVAYKLYLWAVKGFIYIMGRYI